MGIREHKALAISNVQKLKDTESSLRTRPQLVYSLS